MGAPIPQRITESLDFLMRADPMGVGEFRCSQIEKLQLLVTESQSKTGERNALIRQEITSGRKKFKSAALRQMLGDSPPLRAIDGYPVAFLDSRRLGVFSPDGASTFSDRAKGPSHIAEIWQTIISRRRVRGRASDFEMIRYYGADRFLTSRKAPPRPPY